MHTISPTNLTDKELIRFTENGDDAPVPFAWALELARRLEERNEQLKELLTQDDEY